MNRRLELLIVVAVLFSGLLILFWDVFARGYVQVPADLVFNDPVMRSAAPSGFVQPNNGLLGDLVYQFYVWHSIAARAIQSTGKIPLWNPYLLAGQPIVANSQPALFYPVNLLLFFLDPSVVATLRDFFNIVVAGIFTFLFCRDLKISFSGALLACIAFAFSGAIMVGPGHAYASSLVWLPLIFWGSEKIIQSRKIFWSLVVASGVALSILGGHPETVFHNMLATGLYFLSRLFLLDEKRSTKIRLTGLFIFSLMIGFMLGAVQWIPFAAFLSNSGLVSRSRSFTPASMFYSPEWLANLSTLITLVFPNFFGNPTDGTYFWPFSNFQNYLEQSMNFGLVPAALAIGTIATSARKNAPALIISALAIFCLLIAFRVPGFEGLNYLPVMDRANNTRLKWTFAFLGAILSGFGLDELHRYFISRRPENQKFFLVSAAIVVGALLIFVWIRTWKSLVIATTMQIDPNTRQLLFGVFAASQYRTMVTLFAIGLVLAGYLAIRIKSARCNFFQSLLIIATFAELMVIDLGYNTLVPKSLVFPPVRLTEELHKDTSVFRVLEVPSVFSPNYGAVYGIAYVGGYDLPVLKNYAEVYLAQGGKGYRQAWSPDWPLVDWMNVKYIVSAGEQKLDKYELVFADDGYRLYRNKNVLPRAFIVHDWQATPDSGTLLETLTNGTFDFINRVVLEQPLDQNQADSISKPASRDSENVQFTNYSNDSVEMQANAQSPGLLVMSDVIAPGWQVWVDDAPSELLRANYAFRAVFIPAGSHRVRMEYHPIEFTVGSWLTVAALGIVIAGLPLTYWKGL